MSDSFQPVRKQSLADAVFKQLRDRILGGSLEAGESLPAERELAEMLDVNRGAVREALKRLEQARLISIRHGGGTTVLDYRRTAGTDLLIALLLDDEGKLNRKVARSILEMRSALAPSIAYYCALRSPEAGKRLDPIVEEMAANSENLKELQLLSLSFWEILVEGSENIAYALAFNSLRESYKHFAGLLTMAMAAEFEALEEYEALRDAVHRSDPDEAARHGNQIVEKGALSLQTLLDLLP